MLYTCTRFGAEQLARTIQDYWHSRGYRRVTARVVEMPGFEGLWRVTSNLVAGMPPGQQYSSEANRLVEAVR